MSDRTKPPPGWEPYTMVHGMFTRSNAAMSLGQAWAIYDGEAAPAVSEAAEAIAAWLERYGDTYMLADSGEYYTVDALGMAAAVRAGAWRK